MKQAYGGGRLHLNRDRKAVISEGLEAETARLLGGLPHRHQIPRTLQVKRHPLHHLEGVTAISTVDLSPKMQPQTRISTRVSLHV